MSAWLYKVRKTIKCKMILLSTGNTVSIVLLLRSGLLT